MTGNFTLFALSLETKGGLFCKQRHLINERKVSVFLLLLLLLVVHIARCQICTACSLGLEVTTSV